MRSPDSINHYVMASSGSRGTHKSLGEMREVHPAEGVGNATSEANSDFGKNGQSEWSSIATPKANKDDGHGKNSIRQAPCVNGELRPSSSEQASQKTRNQNTSSESNHAKPSEPPNTASSTVPPICQNLLPRLTLDDVSNRLAVMRKQEETFYRTSDYVALVQEVVDELPHLSSLSRLAVSESLDGTEASNEEGAAKKSRTANADTCHRNSPTRQRSMPAQFLPVDEECRLKMCEWCYQVIDFCKLRRETVSISMSFLDRYAYLSHTRHMASEDWDDKSYKSLHEGGGYVSSSSSSNPASDSEDDDSHGNRSSSSRKRSHASSGHKKSILMDRRKYQLAAMTCLYLAIKIFEPPLPVSTVSRLSRGVYTEEEIEAMEVEILFTLNWRVMGVPTVLGFIYHFVALLPPILGVSNAAPDNDAAQVSDAAPSNTVRCTNKSMDSINSILVKLLDFAQFQAELAVGDYSFINHKPSHVALAALMNAMDVLSEENEDEFFWMEMRHEFLKNVSMALWQTSTSLSLVDGSKEHPFSNEIEVVRAKLRRVFWKSTGQSLPQVCCLKWCDYANHVRRYLACDRLGEHMQIDDHFLVPN